MYSPEHKASKVRLSLPTEPGKFWKSSPRNLANPFRASQTVIGENSPRNAPPPVRDPSKSLAVILSPTASKLLIDKARKPYRNFTLLDSPSMTIAEENEFSATFDSNQIESRNL